MNLKLKKVALTGLVVAANLIMVTTPALAATNPGNCKFGNIEGCATSDYLFGNGFCNNADSCIKLVVNLAFLISVLLAFGFLVWGGIDYIMAGGDPGKVTLAQGKITNAVVGLIVVILAWAITNFVLSLFTGNNLTNYMPPGA